MQQDNQVVSIVLPLHVTMPLPRKAYGYIKELIVSRGFRPGQKLPSEPELSKLLNISRTSLRAALDRLELGGYIERKRGLGTFVIGPNPFQVDDGIEKLHSDTDVITSRGLIPSIGEISILPGVADAEVADKLHLGVGDAVTLIDRLRLASGEPFAWDSNIFPAALIPPHTKASTIGVSLLKYTTERLDLHISHAVTYLYPAQCDEFLSEKLGVPLASLMMHWVQVLYTQDNIPVWHSRIWYPAHVASWHVVRTP